MTQNCNDRNFAKGGVGKKQTMLNEICSDERDDQKVFKRGENTAMTVMVSMPCPPIRIFSDHVLSLPRVRLGNLRGLVDVRYQASSLAHRGAKSIDRHFGSSSCLAPSVIAV
jgi:hypothetical protein